MIVHYSNNFFNDALPLADLILVETGTLISVNGFLKLSTRSGLEIVDRYAGIEKELGGYFSKVLEPVEELKGGEKIYQNYLLLLSPGWPDRKMGFIQTARHNAHFDDAVAGEAIETLADWMSEHPGVRVDLPLLGYSYSNVDVDEVIQLMDSCLGVNAHVWFPMSMMPKRVCLPDEHIYKDIVETKDSFIRAGKMRYRDEWEGYLSALYTCVGRSQAERLIQWMAIEQYAMTGNQSSAYVVSRSRMEQQVILYGVEEGE